MRSTIHDPADPDTFMENQGTSYDDPRDFRSLEAVLAGASGDLGCACRASEIVRRPFEGFQLLLRSRVRDKVSEFRIKVALFAIHGGCDCDGCTSLLKSTNASLGLGRALG